MRKVLENCDYQGHVALWWHGQGTLRWQEFWSFVITKAKEHCDDTVMEHCDDKNSGALWWQGPWYIVMTRARKTAMTRILEHCAERAWSIVIKGDKEHCDDMGREFCDDRGHGALGWHGYGTFWWQGFWSIVMTRSKNIAMTRILEHCDGRAWCIVIKGDQEHCDDMGR